MIKCLHTEEEEDEELEELEEEEEEENGEFMSNGLHRLCTSSTSTTSSSSSCSNSKRQEEEIARRCGRGEFRSAVRAPGAHTGAYSQRSAL